MSAHRPIESTADLLVTLWRGKIAIVVATVLGGVIAAIISLLIPRAYTAEASLLISDSRLATNAAVSTHFNPRLNFTYVGMIQRGEVLQEIIDAHPELQEKEIQIEDLDDAIEVTLVNNSRLINIAVTLFDPALAAEICNDLAERAERFTQQELHADQAENIRQRLQPDLDAAQVDLQLAEAALAQASENGSRQSLEQTLFSLSEALTQMEGERGVLAAQLQAQRDDQALEQPLDQRIIALQSEIKAFRESSGVESLREEFQSLWLQRTALLRERNSLPGSDEGRADIDDQISTLESEASAMEPTLSQAELEEQRLQSEYNSLITEREDLYSLSTPTLQAMVAGYDQELAAMNERAATLRGQIGDAMTEQQVAQARVEIAATSLKSLQVAYAEAALRLEEKQQGLEVFDAATVPFYPSAPKRKAMTVLAAALAMLLACAWVVARENVLAAMESQPGR